MSDTLRRESLFGRGVLQRAKALLWMRYTVEEIAEELHVDASRIWADWLPEGAPAQQDDSGDLWIVGTDLRDWILAENNRRREGDRLRPGHAYCTQCEATREMVGPIDRRVVSSVLGLVEARCSQCGAVVFRGVRKESQLDSPTELA